MDPLTKLLRMKIYNTLTKTKEKFVPRKGKEVKMFVCGPTVYDYIHLGNARTFVFFDVMAKYLRHSGYEVQYIQNITDIDDKIINRAKEAGEDPLSFAKKYEEIFLNDMKALGVTAVSDYDQYARATDHIPEVVKQVKKLIEKGHAYLIENDGWYFDLSTFPEYGKLSGRTAEQAEDATSRIDENVNKKNKGDFALWKFSKPGEPFWETELDKGRPGWHIEDTAITEKYFGPQYDLHGAGQDLMFPHHEAEIAQQESSSGLKPFVKYWLHSGFLVSKEKKMSKSLGNFMTLNEALKIYSPETLRFYFLSAHYRSPLDFSEEILKQSEAAVSRFGELMTKVKKRLDSNLSAKIEIISGPRQKFSLEDTKKEFKEALEDDFNTANAFGKLFEFVKKFNKEPDTNKYHQSNLIESIHEFLQDVNKIFGIIPHTIVQIPEEVENLIDKRDEARETKDFISADQLRSQIESLGYQIDDTIYGPLVKKK